MPAKHVCSRQCLRCDAKWLQVVADGCKCFPCTAGIKQGCPASPLLVGLYLDALEGYLVGQGTELHGALDGPSLAQQVIPLLLFADDLVLVSQTECGLQSQLNSACLL